MPAQRQNEKTENGKKKVENGTDVRHLCCKEMVETVDYKISGTSACSKQLKILYRHEKSEKMKGQVKQYKGITDLICSINFRATSLSIGQDGTAITM